jgi:diaminopimelate decarboxylase
VDSFLYRSGELHAEDVPVRRMAEAVGTPFYCYSTAALIRSYREFADAFAGADATICYAVKANSNVAVIRTLANQGAGADVVSEGELRRALAAGVPGDRIVFSGVGKTRAEMAVALDAGILQFNVESEPELNALSEVAASRDVRAPIAIRLNPDIDAGSHDKITTGRKHDKFGVSWSKARELYAAARDLPGINATGVAVHIGSQILSLDPFRAAFRFAAGAAAALRDDGIGIRRIDLGGGLGIAYGAENPPSPAAYAALVLAETANSGCAVVVEPGRVLVGSAGVLVTEVLYEKDADGARVVVVDAAMNDLIRPALYGASHAIEPVAEVTPETLTPADVVGPVCETGDTFARRVPLAPSPAGSLFALRTAGAYGAALASTYNSRPLVPEILVNGAEFAVIRPRQKYEDLIAAEVGPPWLA